MRQLSRKFAGGFLLLWTAALLLGDAGAQNISAEEVKAQYILKMRPFVQVGEPARSIRKICYYEKSGIPENESVGQLIAKYLQSHPPKEGQAAITVKAYKGMGDFSGCDVFFIASKEENNIDNILASLNGAETLTVSGAERFIFRGGMIGFVLDDQNRVRMEVNLKNARAKNVKIPSKILEIMQQVVQ